MTPYRGRFAPSPTGPLHFGSLIAALGSFCEARARRGEWLVRLEDLDRPREAPGAADAILRTLEQFGFEWQGTVMRQSDRDPAYRLAIETLLSRGALYYCACTRKEIADSAATFASDRAAGGPQESALSGNGERPGGEGQPVERVYPGTCRGGLPPGRAARVTRVRVADETISFCDRVQGNITQNLERDVGDFVVRRADGLFAYQLAVVVDDAAQRITEVVRGADLLGSTARQIYLQRLLGYATPSYAHLPAAVNARGEKLSKQTRAPALDAAHAVETLIAALAFLGQSPPQALLRASLRELWQWIDENWDLAKAPRLRARQAPQN
ncbi:MAG: tRNA glutamyl-Q(34) synthetase GluQRS [Betaproteobacteria bacterium]|nr:tRNA glutamyl-Q(34) synthetase GluQRS [Betaproteobacteria bacterium]